MKTKICFFSAGFAFNRLNRMKYYEKIFPKDAEIILLTTDKYLNKEKENYQYKWNLKRTKIFRINYNPLLLPFKLRRFCAEQKVDRVMNIGSYFSAPLLLFVTFFKKRDYIINIFSDIFNQYKFSKRKIHSFFYLLNLIYLYPFMHFAKRVNFSDKLNSKRARTFFFLRKNKSNFLPPATDTYLFCPKNKTSSRKKLNLPVDKKIILFVGRINYPKCSDILKELVKLNPDIYFVLIGRLIDKDFKKFSYKNLLHIEKKSSKELVDYYSASDLGFCINRGGGGIGIATQESLSCGRPVLVSKFFKLKKSKALCQVNFDVKDINSIVKKYFKLGKSEKKSISKFARNYATENYSQNSWRKKYIKLYLH